MVGARAGGLRKPIKWFSMPQLFRYERQQRGGCASTSSSTSTSSARRRRRRRRAARRRHRRAARVRADRDDFVARVSDRRLLRALLLHAQVPEERLTLVYNIVDKLEREPREVDRPAAAEEAGLGPARSSEVLAIFRTATSTRCAARTAASRGSRRRSRAWRATSGTCARWGWRLRALRPLGGARPGLLHGDRVRAVRRARRAARDRGGGRYDNLLGRSPAPTCPRSASGWATWCCASCSPTAGCSRDEPRSGLLPRGRHPESGRRCSARAPAARRGPLRRVRLRHQGVGKQFKAAGRWARAAVVLGPTRWPRAPWSPWTWDRRGARPASRSARPLAEPPDGDEERAASSADGVGLRLGRRCSRLFVAVFGALFLAWVPPGTKRWLAPVAAAWRDWRRAPVEPADPSGGLRMRRPVERKPMAQR
jgi:hypothetical protein